MFSINFTPVLIASVVSFIIGALWYSPILFGKEWQALSKVSAADIALAKSKGMWKSYLIHFIASLVSFLVVSFLISSIGITSANDGASLGFILWLGLVLPMGVSEILWKRAPGKLVLIDQVNILISLIIGSAIVAGM